MKRVLLSYCLYGHENDLAMAFHGLLLIGLTVITFLKNFGNEKHASSLGYTLAPTLSIVVKIDK